MVVSRNVNLWTEICYIMLTMISDQFVTGLVEWSFTGQYCSTPQDCRGENFVCENRKCKCPDYSVEVDLSCLPKIKPGHSPCFRDEQCQAMWPETKCINTICQCTKGTHLLTRDGIVCIEHESCPLGGKETILKNSNNSAVECFDGPDRYINGCSDQLYMYDCMKERQGNGGRNYCCPNKANACNQPMDIGRAVQLEEIEISKIIPFYFHHSASPHSATRWYMNKRTGECTQFDYLGTGGNANNFLSKDHCESYCKTSCPRGNPMFRHGPAGEMNQFSQRQQMCDPSVGCGDPFYKCTLIQTGKAICCPAREFICSEYGGISQRKFDMPYDRGVFCGASRISSQRFYFDSYSKVCLPFDYHGCGGNFNNFETKEQCEDYCLLNINKDRQTSSLY